MKDIPDEVKSCTAEIEQSLFVQIETLNRKKMSLMADLAQIAERKQRVLAKQKEELSTKLAKTEALYKRVSDVVKTPIALERLDTRKEEIVSDCSLDINNQLKELSMVDPIDVALDMDSFQQAIGAFGAVACFKRAPVPELLRVTEEQRYWREAIQEAGTVDLTVEWRVERLQKNQDEMIKIQWTLVTFDDQDEWLEKVIPLQDDTSNATIRIREYRDDDGFSAKAFKCRLSYNDGVNLIYSPHSNTRKWMVV